MNVCASMLGDQRGSFQASSPGGGLPSNGLLRRRRGAFTLLEVMFALGIFFMAVFAILDLTSQCLRSARALRVPRVDAASLAAELSLTNRLEEGVTTGDFGDLYPGYSWEQEVLLSGTNGLYQVDFVVLNPRAEIDSTLSILLYRSQSSVGGRNGGNPRRR